MDLLLIRNKLCSGFSIYDIPLRVTYYARVSTDASEQLNSLNNQNNFFEELIKSNKNWKYVKGYVDAGISGISDKKRYEFMHMIEDAKKGIFDLIITKEISRFSRNTLDSIKYTRELLENGVCVYFLSDNINTIYTDSELRLTIMSSLAQDEIRRISERVKFGMKRSMKEGHILGNNYLYGYRKSKNNTLLINKKESEVIKKIFNMYVYEDKSLNFISKTLNEQSIKTSMNNKWSVTTIKRIIENPKYKGYYCAHKSEVVDYITKKVIHYDEKDWIMYKDYKKIPPIIDNDLWDKANKKLKINNREGIYKKSDFAYSTLIRCAYDDSLFYRRVMKNDASWYCSNKLKNGKKTCDSKSIFESELNEIIKYINDKLNISYEQICFNLNEAYIKLSKQIKKKSKKTIINSNNIVNDYKEKIYSIMNTNEFYNKYIYLLIDKIFVLNKNDTIILHILLKINLSEFYFKKFVFKRDNKEIVYLVHFIGLT